MESHVLWLVTSVASILAALVGFGLYWAERHARALEQVRAAAELRHLQGRAQALDEDLRRAQTEAAESRARADGLAAELGEREQALAATHARLEQIARLETALAELRAAYEQRTRAWQEASAALARLDSELNAERRRAAEAAAAFEQAEARMLERFQALAAQVLEEKGQRLGEQQSERLQHLLEPLQQRLREFQQDALRVHQEGQIERSLLKQELQALKALNQTLGIEAANLTRALRGEARVRGAWGEMVLDRILEASGLQAGREYLVQSVLQSESGQRPRPDVLVLLPEQRAIVIDAKVNLVDYERACASNAAEDKDAALRAHVQALRHHVLGLERRDYAGLIAQRTLDFVLMFVPIEAALLDALRLDGGLFEFALERKVAIVSPSTLLATLRTVAQVWRYERRNQNALEIAERAGKLYDQFASFTADLLEIRAHLEKASASSESAWRRLSEGRGNLLRQVEHLRELGAKAQRRLPEAAQRARAADEASGTVDAPKPS